MQIVPGIDRRKRGERIGVDVVAASAEVVVGVPVDVGRQHGDSGHWLGRRDDPGEGEETAGLRGGVEVVETGSFRRLDVLLMGGVGIALPVPLDAGPGVVAVGRDLHGRARTVFVVPADVPDVLLLPAVPVQCELVGFHRVHAEFGFITGADPLGPHVAQQAVPQQPELVGPIVARSHADALETEIPTGQGDLVRSAGRHVRVHRPRSPGSGFNGLPFGFELEQDFGKGDVPFVADVPYEHLDLRRADIFIRVLVAMGAAKKHGASGSGVWPPR